MLFWLREIAGWLLVGFAVWLLVIALDYVSHRQGVESGVVAFIGLGVLKGGVLLVRVSTAARLAMQIDEPASSKVR